MTAVVLLCGCSGDVTSNAPAIPQATATTATPLTEHLTFSGDLSGTITAGLDPRPLMHYNPFPDATEQPDGSFSVPPPRFTQCSTFDAMNLGTLNYYVAVIIGVIGGQRYAVAFEILMDNAGYTHPGTPVSLPNNVNGSVVVDEVGGQNRVWSDVLAPSYQSSAVVLHPDRKSGTVDVWLVFPNGRSLSGLTGTLHLQGDWRCG